MSQSLLLQIARESITEVFEAQTTIKKEELYKQYPALKEHIASFITIYLDDELRGSMGSVLPTRPLLDDIIHNAKSAAFEDSRFTPLKTSEYLRSSLELSLLTEPKELSYDTIDDIKGQTRCGEDGLIITLGEKQAAFLPQIWAQLHDFDAFFSHLLQEAGLSTDQMQEHPQIFTFQVEKQIDKPILQ